MRSKFYQNCPITVTEDMSKTLNVYDRKTDRHTGVYNGFDSKLNKLSGTIC